MKGLKNVFRSISIWDKYLFTEGSVVKLTGFSPENGKTFEGQYFLVESTHFDKLTVRQYDGETFDIYIYEVETEIDPLEVKLYCMVPYRMPF